MGAWGKPGVRKQSVDWDLPTPGVSQEVLLRTAAKASLHLQQPQPQQILQSQASGDLVTETGASAAVTAFSTGWREQGRNELTLPLPGQPGSALCPLSAPCHQALGAGTDKWKRLLWSQACQPDPTCRFCKVDNQGIIGN